VSFGTTAPYSIIHVQTFLHQHLTEILKVTVTNKLHKLSRSLLMKIKDLLCSIKAHIGEGDNFIDHQCYTMFVLMHVKHIHAIFQGKY
jgi:hypothetical protein